MLKFMIIFILTSTSCIWSQTCGDGISETVSKGSRKGPTINRSTPVIPTRTIERDVHFSEFGTASSYDRNQSYNIYTYPSGQRTTTYQEYIATIATGGKMQWTTVGPVKTENNFHMWKDVCGVGDNLNAGFQIRIFSKDNDVRRYREGNAFKLDKPIFITQGFDPGYGNSESQFNFRQFQGLLDEVYDESTNPTLLPDAGALNTLYDEGYDIVMFLWKHPNIDIAVNAMVAIKALQFIENHSLQSTDNEMAIIGPSMGGLVTRYALQTAGQWGRLSGVYAGLFIAWDSPNRGAVIPMSLQATVKYLSKQNSSVGTLHRNLTSVAARQMLLTSVQERFDENASQFVGDYEDPQSDHGKFMATINNADFRKSIKGITNRRFDLPSSALTPIHTAAIVNGSGSGKDFGLPENTKYGIIDALTLDLQVSTSNAGNKKEVFYGDAGNANPWHYGFNEPVFIENVPGGYRGSYGQIKRSLEDSEYAWRGWNSKFIDHSFIPTFSGLGLLNGDIKLKSTWYTQLPNISMFDEIFYPIENQEHVRLTRQNNAWLLNLIYQHGPKL